MDDDGSYAIGMMLLDGPDEVHERCGVFGYTHVRPGGVVELDNFTDVVPKLQILYTCIFSVYKQIECQLCL